jgi:hypothetical protein
MTEAVRTFETSVCVDETTRLYIQESFLIHTCRRESLKSHNKLIASNVILIMIAAVVGYIRNWNNFESICGNMSSTLKVMQKSIQNSAFHYMNSIIVSNRKFSQHRRISVEYRPRQEMKLSLRDML